MKEKIRGQTVWKEGNTGLGAAYCVAPARSRADSGFAACKHAASPLNYVLD